MKHKMTPCGRSFLAAFLVTAFTSVLQIQRGFVLWHALSDGFFAAAVILLGVCGLRFVARSGFFDIPAYGLASLFSTHFPQYGKNEGFLEWKERRAEKEKPLRYLLIVGTVCLILSFLMLGWRFVS